jgi:non-specific serine/threonine protein kinase
MAKKEVPTFIRDEAETPRGAIWKLGRFELDEGRRELRRDGTVVELEPKPLNLLMLMLRHPRELLTKDELFDALWAGRMLSESVLTSCVGKLRQALGEYHEEWIRTVHGYGYRYDGPAELLDQAPTPVAPPSLLLEAGDGIPGRPHWLLKRRLGRSGDVWLAEHRKTHAQRVFKFSKDAQTLSSLKREVTIYRLLSESLGDQARLVHILDWNFDELPSFIESQYCAGGSLQEWFDAQGGVLAIPLAVRLALFADICEAVSGVHALGVLHKDIKPANILVDVDRSGTPNIRLADFGSGRLTDATRLEALNITRIGFTQIADDSRTHGTPLYYAPEVISGKPFTVQADIYALGVMLFQLVVGNLRRPLASGWEREIDDPELRHDIAQACEIEPARRLADASALATNLRHLDERRQLRLRDEAEQREAAAAAKLMEQLRARRARVRTALGALSVGLIVSIGMYFDARSARARAEREAQRAQAVTDFLNNDMLAGIDPNQVSLRNLSVKQLLDRGYGEVGARFSGSPLIAASIYETLGRSYAALDYEDESAESYSHAQRLYESLGNASLPALLDVSGRLALVQWATGALTPQLPHFDAILARGRDQLGATDPAVVRYTAQLARARIQLGRWNEGVADLRALEALLPQVHAGEAFELELQQALCFALLEQGNFIEAARRARQIVETVRQHYGDNSGAMATARWRLAFALMNSGHLDEAETELAVARTLTEHLLKDDSGAAYAVRLYEAQLRLEQGRFADAEHLLRALLRSVSAYDSDSSMDQSYTERWPLSEALLAQGHYTEARAMAEAAATAAARTLGQNHPKTQGMRARVRMIAALQGKPIQAPPPGPIEEISSNHPFHLDLLLARSMEARAAGDSEGAKTLAEQRRRLMREQYAADSWRMQADIEVTAATAAHALTRAQGTSEREH